MGRRSPSTMWADAIRQEALKVGRNEGEDRKKLNRLAVKLLERALEGDVAAIKEVGDRLDGKPRQAVDMGGQPDNPLLAKLLVEHVRSDGQDPNT